MTKRPSDLVGCASGVLPFQKHCRKELRRPVRLPIYHFRVLCSCRPDGTRTRDSTVKGWRLKPLVDRALLRFPATPTVCSFRKVDNLHAFSFLRFPYLVRFVRAKRNKPLFMSMKNKSCFMSSGVGWDSNPRLTEPQSVVLPTELPTPYQAFPIRFRILCSVV